MKKFKVLLNVDDIWLTVNGKDRLMGYFQSFNINAQTAKEVESIAKKQIWDSDTLNLWVEAKQKQPPRILVEEIVEVLEFDSTEHGKSFLRKMSSHQEYTNDFKCIICSNKHRTLTLLDFPQLDIIKEVTSGYLDFSLDFVDSDSFVVDRKTAYLKSQITISIRDLDDDLDMMIWVQVNKDEFSAEDFATKQSVILKGKLDRPIPFYKQKSWCRSEDQNCIELG